MEGYSRYPPDLRRKRCDSIQFAIYLRLNGIKTLTTPSETNKKKKWKEAISRKSFHKKTSLWRSEFNVASAFNQ